MTLELSENELLKFKNITLEIQLLQVKMSSLQASSASLSVAVAERLGIDIEDYSLDMDKGVLLPKPKRVASGE